MAVIPTSPSPAPNAYPYKWWVIAGSVMASMMCALGAVVVLMAFNVVTLGVVTGAFAALLGSNAYFLQLLKAAGLVH